MLKPELSIVFILSFFTVSHQAFALPDKIEGWDLATQKKIDLDLSKSAKNTVVVFLSTQCPCSIGHEPVLKKLATKYQVKFQFIGIHSAVDAELSKALEHFKQSQLPFPVIQDNNAYFADLFEAYKTPHVFILDSASKKILFQGGVDNSHNPLQATEHYLEDTLFAIHNNQTIRKKEARTLGCAIRRP